MSSAPFTIYVTHVEAMGQFVKICGQTNRQAMEDIESTLRHMHLMLMSHQLEPLLNEINCTDIYLVQANKEALFRRCQALDVRRNGLVKVFLMDYGQELEVHVSQMQLVANTKEGSLLLSHGAQVQYGVLAGVYLDEQHSQLATIASHLVDAQYILAVEDRIASVDIITLLTKLGQNVNESLIFQSLAYRIAPREQTIELRELRAQPPNNNNHHPQQQQQSIAERPGSAARSRTPASYFAVLDAFANDGMGMRGQSGGVTGGGFGSGRLPSGAISAPTPPPPTTRGLVPSRPLSAATQQYTLAAGGQLHYQQSRNAASMFQPTPLQPAAPAAATPSKLQPARGLVAARPLKLITTTRSASALANPSADNQLDASGSSSASSASSTTSAARIPVLPPRNLSYRPNITLAERAIVAQPSLLQQPSGGKGSSTVVATASSSCQMPTFSSNTLLVRSRHRVYIPYIEDGPSLFSVHLKAQEHDLDSMMSALGNWPLQNLHTKPLLGQACVARYAEDSNLYRAVIMNIRPTSCLVAYVDYGNTGDVPFADLYHIPAEFLQHQCFAMRFTLAGYQQLQPLSREVQRVFRSLVQDAELELLVRPLDGPPCVQYCELYAYGGAGSVAISVFDRLLAVKSTRRHFGGAEQLREQELVIIRCIESAKQFYVQPCRSLPAYEQMQRTLQAYGAQQVAVATHAPARLGEPCMVWHRLNREWNRAEVVELLGGGGAAEQQGESPGGGGQSQRPSVVVQYVDLGSVDEARADELKQLPGDFLQLPRQVVECCLESFVNVESVSKLTLQQMEMLADREDGHPRAFKVNICSALGEMGGDHSGVGRRQALVVNLIDASVTPILDLSQSVFMLCMPLKQFRAYEQQRYQRMTSQMMLEDGDASGLQDAVPDPQVAATAMLLSSTTLNTPDASPNNSTEHGSNNNNIGNKARAGTWDRAARNQAANQAAAAAAGGKQQQPAAAQANWRRQQEDNGPAPNAAGAAAATSWHQHHQQQELQQQQQQQQQQQLQRRSDDRSAKPAAIVSQNQLAEQQHPAQEQQQQPPSRPNSAKPQQTKSKEIPAHVKIGDDLDTSSGHFSNQSSGSAASAPDLTAICISATAVQLNDAAGPRAATISYWRSPLEFYVQPRDTHDAFVAMMTQMQDNYRNSVALPPAIAASLAPGTYVVCRKAATFCRAQVLRPAPAVTATADSIGLELQFIDTGDRMQLQPDSIYPVDRRFAKQPRHAIRCALPGIAQAADKLQLARHVQRLMSGKADDTTTPVGVVFVAKAPPPASAAATADDEDAGWLVAVSIGDEGSLREQLVREQLVVALPEAVQLATLLGQTLVIEVHERKMGGRLLGSVYGCQPGQQLVFVAADREMEALEATATKGGADGVELWMARIEAITDENVLEISALPTNPPPTFLRCCGGLLTAPLLAPHFGIQVVTVDPQAVNIVHLQNVGHAEDGDHLIEAMYTAYQAGDASPASLAATRLSTRQLCAGRSLADGNWYRCLIEELPNTGAATASDATDDGLVCVRYVDYGNCERLPREHLRELLPQFRRPDALSLKCYLALRPPAGAAERVATLAKIESLTHGWALELTVLASHAGHWIVDIFGNGRSLRTVLRDFGLAEPLAVDDVRRQIDADLARLSAIETETAVPVAQPVAVPAATVTAEPIDIYAGRTECYLSHTDHPDRFYLRRVADEPALLKMQEDIQIVAASLPDLTDFTVGGWCICQYTGDDLWYRASIIDSGSGITSVQFIDYGNTDTITQPGLIKAMPEAAFSDREPFAIACMLPVAINCAGNKSATAAANTTTTASTTEWPEEACAVMRSLLDARLAFEFLTCGVSCSVVSLWAPPAIDVSLQLVEAGWARPVPYIPNGQRAFVSHINSLSDFYVQMDGESRSLEIIDDYLQAIEQFEPLPAQSVRVNVICTARYAEDGGWYRARILSAPAAEDGGIEVLFIDYGNASVVHELRELPANIAGLPHLSRQCSLQRPPDVALWSDEAERRFVECASAGATVFQVRLVRPSNRASVVEMSYGGGDDEQQQVGGDLSVELAALCDKFCMAEVDRLNSSMIASSSFGGAAAEAQEGCVFRVQSAQDFCVRLAENREQFAEICERLAAPEASDWPAVSVLNAGDLCAARSPADGRLYRAVIAEISSEGKHLCQLFDEGVQVEASELRVLPADLTQPDKCYVHCHLQPSVAEQQQSTNSPVIRRGDSCYVQYVADKRAKAAPADSQQPQTVRLFADVELEHEVFEVQPQLEQHSTEQSFVGFLTSALASADFWVQPETVTDQYNVLRARLDALLPAEVETPPSQCAEGTLCVALFAADGLFYRARVLQVVDDAEEGGYLVTFIDYGNTAASMHLCELPADLAAIPQLASRFALAERKPDDEAGGDGVGLTEAQFVGLASQTEKAFYFEPVAGEKTASGCSLVRMFRDPEHTDEIFVVAAADEAEAAPVEECVAALAAPVDDANVDLPNNATAIEADALPQQPDTEVAEAAEVAQATATATATPLAAGAEFAAPISWTISAAEFYVHAPHLAETLALLGERLATAMAIGLLAGPELGELCAARFEDDGLYYRAKIRAIDAEKGEYNVLFVDYGNKADVTDIRVLPDDLRALDFCAVRCALQPTEKKQQEPAEADAEEAESDAGVLSETQFYELVAYDATYPYYFQVLQPATDLSDGEQQLVVRMWKNADHLDEIQVAR